MANEIKKNSKLKKILIGTAVAGTLIAGAAAVTYAFVPQVHEIVDDIINPITSPKLEQLQAVQNIAFDEDSKTLTFDAVNKANGYEVKIENKNLTIGGFSYETPTNSVVVAFPEGSETGHTVHFMVTALGDYKTTRKSEEATFDYVLQFETEKLYSALQERICNFTQTCVNRLAPNNVSLYSIDTMKIDGNKVIISGDYSRSNVPSYYHLSVNLSKYLETHNNFTKYTDFEKLVYAIANTRITTVGNIAMENHIVADYTDYTSGLIKSSPVLKEYVNNGYTVTNLEHTNTALTSTEGGERILTVNGVYKAVNAAKEAVTFDLEDVAIFEKNNSFTTDQEYLNNFIATGSGFVTDTKVDFYDAGMMKHVNMIDDIYQQKIKAYQDSLNKAKDNQQQGMEL